MTCFWQTDSDYRQGDVVEYCGHKYKNIQPHCSQDDWTPDKTPAMWHRERGSCSNERKEGQCHPSPHHEGDPVHATQDEKRGGWQGLSDERKKELEVGGALALGAALLGGGFALFKHHEKDEEEKKAQTWALSHWVADAKARTARYEREGLQGPCAWIYNEGNEIPRNAIFVSKEHSWNLYICRTFCDGGIQIGKASEAFKGGAVIGYQNEEVHLNAYEILVGDETGLQWVPVSGKLHIEGLGCEPVEGGHENDGTPLYIVKAPHAGVEHPGKTSEKLDGAYIPYDGKEKLVKEYQVLCYN